MEEETKIMEAKSKAIKVKKDSGHYVSPNGVRYLSKAEQKAKTKSWPSYNKEAHEKAHKADSHWEMADKPHLTKGHQVYKEHNK